MVFNNQYQFFKPTSCVNLTTLINYHISLINMQPILVDNLFSLQNVEKCGKNLCVFRRDLKSAHDRLKLNLKQIGCISMNEL